jgi:hypothetical protein
MRLAQWPGDTSNTKQSGAWSWQNYDISHLILGHLEPTSLARLAQTCKALFELTTDELWKTMNSVVPFLSCLPPDFRHRPLRRKDIRRLCIYSSKVQNLLIESESINTVIRLPHQFKPKKNHPETSTRKS